MADFGAVVGLEVGASAEEIRKKIPDLQKVLNNDENARLKLIAQLNLEETKRIIQAQLNTITNQAKVPTIKVGVEVGNQNVTQNMVQGLKTVQTQAQNVASELKAIETQAQKTADATSRVNAVMGNNSGNRDYFSNDRALLQSIQTFQAEEHAVQSLYDIFKSLGAEVTSVERKTSDGFLNGFTVSVKSATGEIENFNYRWKDINEQMRTKTNELPEDWRYALTNITASDKAVQKLIESQQRYNAQVEATITGLKSQADTVKSGLLDTNGAKPIKDEGHVKDIQAQYEKVISTIEQLRSADNTRLAEFKANAKQEIDALKLIGNSYKNAEYVATSLRTKDLNTVVSVQANEIDKFVNKVASSKPVLDAMTQDISELRNALSTVSNADELTKFLNQFDIAKTKFDSLKTLYQGIGQYDAQLDKLAKQWQKQGVYVGDVQKTVEGLKASLAQVNTTEGFTKWVGDFNSQICAISDVPVKVMEFKNQLALAREEWDKQNLLVGEIAKKMRSLKQASNIKSQATLDSKVQEFTELQTAVARVQANLQSQVTAAKEVLSLETQIAKLKTTDSVHGRSLTSQLDDARKNLENYQMQGATLKNIVSLEEQERYVTAQTLEERKQLASVQEQQADKTIAEQTRQLKEYTKETKNAIKALDKLKNDSKFKSTSSDPGTQSMVTQINAATTAWQGFKARLATATPNQIPVLSSELEKLRTQLTTTTSSAENFKRQIGDTKAEDNLKTKISVLTNQITAYKNANGKAMASGKLSSNNMTFAAEIDGLLTKLQQAKDDTSYRQIANQFRVIKSEIKAMGLEGGTFIQNLWANMKKFASWMGMTTIMSRFGMEVRQAVTELKDLDTILTEISKTSDRTEESLRKLGKTSFDTASKYGRTASDYLAGVQEMSRAGFEEGKSEQMAELSVLAQSAGDMTAELANQYLIATNAGYQFAGETDKLNSVLD